MKPRIVLFLCLAMIVIGVCDAAAVVRVARRFNVMEFAFLTADPVGTYSRVGTIDLIDQNDIPFEEKGDEVFNSTWGVALSYGQLRNDVFAGSVGFRYIKVDHKLQFIETTIDFHQVDLDFTLNIHPLKPASSLFSPYVGGTVNAGLTITEPQGYATESALTVGLSANFGFDFKVWSDNTNKSFLTLASINSYNLIASDGRPKYFQIGGGLRYWFKP